MLKKLKAKVKAKLMSKPKASPKAKPKKAVLIDCSDCNWKPGIMDDGSLCLTCEGSGKVKK